MKVHLTIEISDEQRNALSLVDHPRAKKRLATRDEVRTFVESRIASIGRKPRRKTGHELREERTKREQALPERELPAEAYFAKLLRKIKRNAELYPDNSFAGWVVSLTEAEGL